MYLSFWETMFSFHGRIGRLSYLGHSALLLVLTMVAYMTAFSLMSSHGSATSALSLLGIFGILVTFGLSAWSGCSLLVKRLHDIGLSGWYVAAIWGYDLLASMLGSVDANLGFVANLIGLCIGIWVLVARGEAQDNAYGPAPISFVHPAL